MQDKLNSRTFWTVSIGLLCLLVFVIRMTGPSDLEGYAQHRNVGYVMDLMWQGNWVAQYDIQGRILSKPPLHTWTIAPFAALLGVDRLALALPSFVAVLVLALLVFEVGRRRFGMLAGGLAGLAVVLAPTMSKHVALVRSDALFTLTIAVAAFAAFHAWERGRGWTLFWFAAALATLTKGPLGIVLAAAGLLAYFWEQRSDAATPVPRGSHRAGLALFFGLTLSWFLVALYARGYELIDKMFFDELLGQATGARKDSFPGQNLPRPTLYLLARFLPFSLFFFYALWRVFRSPARVPAERRFERFLACWVLVGLLIFSLAAHHRADLLLPLWPACALLAGRELARLAGRVGIARFARIGAAACMLLLASVLLTYHSVWGKRAENADYAEAVKAAAHALAASDIDVARLHHIRTPVTLQMYLGTFRPWLEPSELSRLLAGATEPVHLAVGARSLAELGLDLDGLAAEPVFRWPHDDAEPPLVEVWRLSRP